MEMALRRACGGVAVVAAAAAAELPAAGAGLTAAVATESV